MSGERARGDEMVESWRLRSIVGTMFPLLVALSVLEMGSGMVLETLEETYLDNPTLLILVPVMIGTGGNLGSILSSRLSTRLHLGTLEFSPRNTVLWTNIVAILLLAATIFTTLAFVAYGVGHLLAAPMALSNLLLISVVSGMSLACIAVVLSIATTYLSYRHGLDPDDTTIPIVTNLSDILGVVILSAVAIVVLH